MTVGSAAPVVVGSASNVVDSVICSCTLAATSFTGKKVLLFTQVVKEDNMRYL